MAGGRADALRCALGRNLCLQRAKHKRRTRQNSSSASGRGLLLSRRNGLPLPASGSKRPAVRLLQDACAKSRRIARRHCYSVFLPLRRAPAPQTTPPDSSAAKQTIGQAYVCLALTAITELSDASLSSIGNCPSLSATSPERLSIFCRLNI